jgi:uncharacterized paraquat-inducible protein A
MSKLLIVILSGMMFVAVGCKAEAEVDDTDDSTMSGTSSRTEGSTAAGADACTHCAGTQTAKADGTCSKCGMKVKG